MAADVKIMLGAMAAVVLGTITVAVISGRDQALRGPRREKWEPQPGTPEHTARLRSLPSQRMTEGKWSSPRRGETTTVLDIETPEGTWRAKVHTDDGTWFVRGPDADNEAHYAEGDTKDVDGNDKTVIATAKKRARQYIKDRIK